ncbi:hypothetical protein D3Z52_23490 [Clostridiaceae bacterium]|nr:hypothetical protein [Clostridiaceae bacterium]NBH81026.1 hypothetical protein [Clostridiaceae bacterium]
MTEERKARLSLYREHCVTVEQKLFDAIQVLASRDKMTAADASALAAVTEALLSVQKMQW